MYFKYDIFRAELWYCPVDEIAKKRGEKRSRKAEA